jgi:hypothetical protein
VQHSAQEASHRTGQEPTAVERLAWTLQHAVASVTATSFTTVAAFAANMVSSITPVRLFGLFMVVIVLVNYIFALSLLLALVVIREGKELRLGSSAVNEGSACTPPEVCTRNRRLLRDFPAAIAQLLCHCKSVKRRWGFWGRDGMEMVPLADGAGSGELLAQPESKSGQLSEQDADGVERINQEGLDTLKSGIGNRQHSRFVNGNPQGTECSLNSRKLFVDPYRNMSASDAVTGISDHAVAGMRAEKCGEGWSESASEVKEWQDSGNAALCEKGPNCVVVHEVSNGAGHNIHSPCAQRGEREPAGCERHGQQEIGTLLNASTGLPFTNDKPVLPQLRRRSCCGCLTDGCRIAPGHIWLGGPFASFIRMGRWVIVLLATVAVAFFAWRASFLTLPSSRPTVWRKGANIREYFDLVRHSLCLAMLV